MNSLRIKLANKKVKGLFWPVVESLRGVWAFFLFKFLYFVGRGGGGFIFQFGLYVFNAFNLVLVFQKISF